MMNNQHCTTIGISFSLDCSIDEQSEKKRFPFKEIKYMKAACLPSVFVYISKIIKFKMIAHMCIKICYFSFLVYFII
jgi:hypothetical protein